jgi:hypothetical protein
MTSSMALSGPLSGLLASPRSTGKSDSAEKLVQLRESIRKHLLESYSVRRQAERAITELDEVLDLAAAKGWDGYDGRPVSFWSWVHAKLFIEALPTTVPAPEVSADPDGDVSLDWVFGPRKALTISINASGRCSFAWMRGARTYRGTDWVNDGIPQNIINALAELARDSASSGSR